MSIISVNLPLKAISINKAYSTVRKGPRAGARVKSQAYKDFEQAFKNYMYEYETPDINKNDILELNLVFGIVSKASDLSNLIKTTEDCIVKTLGENGDVFDDKQFYKISLERKKVKKGDEFINFTIKKIGEEK